jgi:hypothetical protein
MKRLVAIVLLVTTALVSPAAQTAASAQSSRVDGLLIPVTGSGGGATFAGTLNLLQFVRDGSTVAAVGVLTGTVTNAAGQTTSIVQTVRLPVAITQATCDILHLDLGPLSLDLLGLQIDLSRIVLDITAESGAGNLLGNLLCAVAGLLDNPSGLARLLNRILEILG